MPDNPKPGFATYLGVDYGERRIGLALAELGGRAKAWRTLTVAVSDDAVPAVCDATHEVAQLAGVVVGLPRNLDGDDTRQTVQVRQFAADLQAKLNVSVTLQDEAGTSSVADERLRQSGRGYSRLDIDAEAAAIILQDYLESQ